MSKNITQTIIVIVVIFIAFFGFKMFFVDNQTSTALTSDSSNPVDFADGQKVIVLLNNLKDVTLDDSIFSNKVFTNLHSFERTLDSQVLNRKNPFLPIGVENTSAVTLKIATSSRTQ